MSDPVEYASPSPSAEMNGRSMQRLQLELALDLGAAGRPPAEVVREAALSAGADLLFVLPAASGNGVTAVLRLREDGRHAFLQVASSGDRFETAEEAKIDANLLRLARASVDVFERLSRDSAIRAPLAATG